MVNIDSVAFGEIRVDGKDYYSDITLTWDGHIRYKEKAHTIELGDVLGFVRDGAEIIVMGAGQTGGVRYAPEVSQFLKDRGVLLYADITSKAAGLFNAFAQQGKRVAGIFHVTC